MQPLLAVNNLKTWFQTDKGIVKAVDGISFSIDAGQTLALVGESGCGKSMTALSLLRLVPEPGQICCGSISFADQELLELSEAQMRRVRGNRMAMVFQEPMTALNPVLKIGEQIAEVLRLHKRLNRAEASREAVELLARVGIPEPELRLRDYPHQLSGGLRQRVVIAMALACQPQLLIADEPTTALDVTIQAQIMALLSNLQQENNMATLLISHDLGVVAESADQVAIMYAGLIVEQCAVDRFFPQASHPYSLGLLASLPRLDSGQSRLTPIAGQVPAATNRPSGCPFRNRCSEAVEQCATDCPALREIAPGHLVRCWRRS